MKKLNVLTRMLLLVALLVGSVSNVWADDVVTWEKTAPTSLVTGDIVLVVDQTNSVALPHNNGTSSSPGKVSVTLNGDKTEVTNPTVTNIQWTVTATGTGDSRTYKLSKDADNHLYVTASNTGVRVGSGDRNTFLITAGGDNDGYYLNNTATESNKSVTRYIGYYNSNSDWRCYTSINNNIKGNNIAFYKKVVETSTESKASAPVFSLASNNYIYGTTFTITSTNAEEIRYTTDGSTPSKSVGTVYSGPISIEGAMTVKAVAIDDEGVATAVVTRTYGVKDPDAPTFSVGAGIVSQGTTVTIEVEDLCVISYTTDGSDPSSSATATLTESNTEDVVVNATMNIRAIAIDDNATEGEEASASYTVLSANIMSEEKTSFSTTSGTIDSDITFASNTGGASTDPANYNNGIRLYQKGGTNTYGGYITLTAPTGFTIKLVQITSTNTYATTVTYTEGNSTDVTENDSYSLAKSSTYTINTNNNQVNIFNLGTGSNGRLEIGAIKVYYVGSGSATLAAACNDGEPTPTYYGTYSNSHAFVVPEGLVVSEIGITGETLNVKAYETGDVVPANTGVMISSATSGAHDITFTGREGTSVLDTDNCLYASGDSDIDADGMETAAAGCKYYRLTMHNGTDLGFYWGAENGAAFGLAANKAFLAIPNALAKEGFTMFDFNKNETDGIKTVEKNIENGVRYNLAGQKVGADYKGIVIVNGKKMLNK